MNGAPARIWPLRDGDSACRRLRGRGFRADLIGVDTYRPDGPCYNRLEIYAIDDWC